jgi:autotransporter-associated beta strand protein
MTINGVHNPTATTRGGALRLWTLAAFIASGVLPSIAAAQSGSWSQTATGSVWNWSDAGNWTAGVVANGANNTATFATSGLSSGVLINLDTARTIGSLSFDNPSNNFGWTIQGTNTLTLNQTGGASIAVNNSAGGTPPVTATIAVPVSGTFNKTGTGNLILSANNTALSGVTVTGGLLGVTSSAGVNPLGTGTVTLAGGTLRLGDGSGYNQRMVVPVSSPGATGFATSGVSATMDAGTALTNYTWYAMGQNTGTPGAGTGLPMGTTITSPATGIQYTLPTANTTTPNGMMMDLQHTTGRFVLATPTTGLSTISFLVGSGNVGTGAGVIRPVITATLHYTDGTPDATGLTFNSPDWFSNTTTGDSVTPAFQAGGRISSAGYSDVVDPPSAASHPNLFDGFVSNPNPSSKVGSVDLSWAVGSGGTQTAIHTVIFAMGTNGAPIPVAGPNAAQTFTNAVSVTADSTIDVQSVAGSTLGNLSIGTNQLSVTGVAQFTSATGVTAANSLAVGAVSLSGNPTFNVASGLTMAATGAFTDGGTVRTVTKTGGGAFTATAASPTLQAGTGVTVNAGTLNLNNATAFGASPAVTINGGSLAVGTGQNPTFGSLNGTSGNLTLNGNTVLIATGSTASYGGTISDGTPAGGKITMGGAGTQTLTGVSAFTGGATVSSGKLVATPGSLGTGAVTLTGGTLAVGPTHTLTGSSLTAANWQLNGTATFPSAGVLQLTNGAGNNFSSAWYKTAFPTGPFTLNFTMTNLNAAAADGFTVGFQTQGLTAVASTGGGSSLGYQGIAPSAALQANIYSPNTDSADGTIIGNQGSGLGVLANGQAPPHVRTSNPVNFGLQNQPTNFAITYDGTNLNVTLTQGANTYSNSYAANISPLGATAFFGFTGATGGTVSQEQITNLAMTSPTFQTAGVYSNNVVVNGSATIQVTAPAGTPNVTMGTLTMGTPGTLAIVPDPTNPANTPYGMIFGGTVANGTDAINVTNNGTGLTSLTLGAVTGAGSLQVTGGPALALAGGNLTGRLDIGTSNATIGGANLTVGSLAGTGNISNGSATAVTLTVGGDNTTSTFGGVIANGGTGALSLFKTGSGSLTLTAVNTYTGGTTVSDGTLGVASDAALGTGAVTISPLGTLAYSATTSTNKSFNLGNGTLAAGAGATVTLIGSSVFNGYLAGPGTFATSPTAATRFASVTTRQSVSIISNNIADRFVNFTNAGALTIATGTAGAVTANGFTNQNAVSSVTMNPLSLFNVSDFSTFGNLNIQPATVTETFANTTLMTNVGTSQLSFGSGSRSFVGTPQTAVFPQTWPDPTLRGLPTFVAGIDLNGKNAVVSGGLFVNNGYVEDSTNNFQGTGTIIADYGSLVKGAGYFQNSVITVNGGKFQAGNSPGRVLFGSLVVGPGGLSNFGWQINDAGPSASFPSAPGVAGPSADANNQVSGWSLIVSQKIRPTDTGNLTWTATNTPGNQFSFSLQTLLGPKTTVGNDIQGAMTSFDPNISFTWPVFQWSGVYTGPTDDTTLTSTVLLDKSNFVNSTNPTAQFIFHYDATNKQIDLVYSVPEPGTMALGGLAAAGLAMRMLRRRKAKAVGS